MNVFLIVSHVLIKQHMPVIVEFVKQKKKHKINLKKLYNIQKGVNSDFLRLECYWPT